MNMQYMAERKEVERNGVWQVMLAILKFIRH